MNARRPLAMMMSIALALLPAIASAQPLDADRGTARTLALEGKKALDDRDYATAADRFSRADALIHAPTLLLGLARAEVGLGKLVAAQELYNRILREGVSPGSPPAFARAVEDAKSELKELAARVPTIILQVSGADDPAVTIDGIPVPRAALGVKRPIDPGQHAIRATAKGFAASEAIVDIPLGKVQTVTLALQPLPMAPLQATAPPPVAAPPPVNPDPQNQGRPASGAVVTGSPSDAGAFKGSTQRTLGMVAIGVGGAGIIIGISTGIVAITRHSALIERCGSPGCPSSLRDEVGGYYTAGAVSTASFIAGGAIGALGAALFFTAPGTRRATAASIEPLLGLGFAGAQGRF